MNFEEFQKSGLSLYVEKDGKEIFTSKEHMLKPVVEAIKKIDFSGTTIYDKIIGRGAAFLFVYAKAKEVFGITVSKLAIQTLDNYNIPYKAENIVENIMNKDNTDICPMEKLSLTVNTPEEFYSLLVNARSNNE